MLCVCLGGPVAMEKPWEPSAWLALTFFLARSKGISPAVKSSLSCLLFWGNPDPQNAWDKPKGREEALKEGRGGAESKRGICRDGRGPLGCCAVMELVLLQGTRTNVGNSQWIYGNLSLGEWCIPGTWFAPPSLEVSKTHQAKP